MKRLRSVPPRVGAPPARVAGLASSGTGWSRSDGLSSTQRGYGADWRALRARILRAEPMCQMCREAGRLVPAAELDHMRPFRGVADPLRLDPTNLRPLCTPHHRTRTARQSTARP